MNFEELTKMCQAAVTAYPQNNYSQAPLLMPPFSPHHQMMLYYNFLLQSSISATPLQPQLSIPVVPPVAVEKETSSPSAGNSFSIQSLLESQTAPHPPQTAPESPTEKSSSSAIEALLKQYAMLEKDEISRYEKYENIGGKSKKARKPRVTEGIFTCEECGKTFGTRNSLTRHKYEHAERTFKCDICDKGFIYKHHFREHMRVHSGEKPYKCDHCQLTFSHSGAHWLHVNRNCKIVRARQSPESTSSSSSTAESPSL